MKVLYSMTMIQHSWKGGMNEMRTQAVPEEKIVATIEKYHKEGWACISIDPVV